MGSESFGPLPSVRFAVIALAGGSLEADFREAGYAVPNKAYLPIGGELMIVRVLQALKSAAAVKQIRCVTQREALASRPQIAQLCDAVIPPGADLIASVLAGLEGLGNDERVLVAATDMPLLTSKAVDAFADLASITPCDVGYGFVERTIHDSKYAGVRHTWVRLREGTFCGSGLSVLRVGAAKQIQDALRRFTDARKSPAKMASLFSFGLVARLLMGQLTVTELEQHANKLTGLTCRGLLCPYPEVAVNVDRASDLRQIERLI